MGIWQRVDMDSLKYLEPEAIFYPFGHPIPYAMAKVTHLESMQNYFWFLFLEVTAILYYSMQIGFIS
jgi:hypothetical protein